MCWGIAEIWSFHLRPIMFSGLLYRLHTTTTVKEKCITRFLDTHRDGNHISIWINNCAIERMSLLMLQHCKSALLLSQILVQLLISKYYCCAARLWWISRLVLVTCINKIVRWLAVITSTVSSLVGLPRCSPSNENYATISRQKWISKLARRAGVVIQPNTNQSKNEQLFAAIPGMSKWTFTHCQKDVQGSKTSYYTRLVISWAHHSKLFCVFWHK